MRIRDLVIGLFVDVSHKLRAVCGLCPQKQDKLRRSMQSGAGTGICHGAIDVSSSVRIHSSLPVMSCTL